MRKRLLYVIAFVSGGVALAQLLRGRNRETLQRLEALARGRG